MTAPREALLDVRGLSIAIPGRSGDQVAVADVDLHVVPGEVLALVGESGSGKSLTMLATLGLLSPNMRASGSIRFDGEEILGAPESRLRALRGRRMSIIFQDPMTALNPVQTIGVQLVEILKLHNPSWSRQRLRDRALDLLRLVSIPAPERRIDQYPHEFSGGMRQRVVIAIAVANDPALLIADEPTTALDVTIQAQIVEILDRLRREKNMSIVLITHDLGLVASLADQVVILYAGRVLERGDVESVYANPRHPYTSALLAAVPSIDGATDRLRTIEGTPPSLASRPPGCQFHPRCEFTAPVCRERAPPLLRLGASLVACHRAAELSLSPEAIPEAARAGV